jgi:transcriptional regulator with XRE-family HTH domain
MAGSGDGPRLQVLREERAWSRAQAAERSGVSRSTIQSRETERTTSSLLDALRVAELYGVSLDWLAGRQGFGRQAEPRAAQETSESQAPDLLPRIPRVINGEDPVPEE